MGSSGPSKVDHLGPGELIEVFKAHALANCNSKLSFLKDWLIIHFCISAESPPRVPLKSSKGTVKTPVVNPAVVPIGNLNSGKLGFLLCC